jgi:hypothetical protein
VAVTTFSIVQSGDEFYCVSADGTQVEGPLVMPAGVTVDGTIRAQYSILNQKVIITRAVTPSVWMDPETFIVRKLSVTAPTAAPTLAAGSGTGLTGSVYGAYSYVVHINGVVVQESPLSPLSAEVVLANDDIDWSALVPSTDAAVTGYRLYRTVQGGDPSTLFLAVTITNPAATGYTGDNVPDASLELLPAPLVGNPPETLGVCVAWGTRLWAVGIEQDEIHVLRYTETDDPFSWPVANTINVPVAGEDQWGVTGFLPRRDMLIVCKRARMSKVIGDSNANFEILMFAEGPGSVSPDSCIVIDDVGYCHGLQGVYEINSQGVKDIADGKVSTWFKTGSLTISRDAELLPLSMGSYNPATNAYELQLIPPGGTNPTIWLAFNRTFQEWTGPHETAAATLTARGTIRDTAGQVQPIVGDDAGYLYLMNQGAAYDLAGPAPTVVVGIAIDWRAKVFTGDPDLFYVWGRLSFFQRAQGSGADGQGGGKPAYVWMFCGDIDERTLYLENAIITPTVIDRMTLTQTKVDLSRPGAGQAMTFWVRHNFVANPNTGALSSVDNSPSDVELWGYDVQYAPVGRR